MRHRHAWLGAALVMAVSAAPALAVPKFTTLAAGLNSPMVGVVQSGVVYGTVASGGAGSGFIFAFPLTIKRLSDIHDFDSTTEGSSPDAGLQSDIAGNLYGATALGGSASGGTLFKFDTSHVLTVLHNFGTGTDGAQPRQGLVRTKSGMIFGSTRIGTPNNAGNIFQLKADGTYTTFYHFLSGNDGHCPYSGITRDAHGNIYGTTWGGGAGGNPTGSVFKINTKGVLTTLYVFKNQNDGEWPDIAPTVDSAGNVYGITRNQNGNTSAGTIWKIDTLGNFTVLHTLNGTTDGFQPNSPLVIGADGNLYGTTHAGGTLSFGGVLFQITPSGTYTVIHNFTNSGDSIVPSGSLVVNGSKIYGGTIGTIFQYQVL
jgi:uncharacterized repeat protein (TIGR03803 family)